jgi:hypothetical protein
MFVVSFEKLQPMPAYAAGDSRTFRTRLNITQPASI